MSRTRILLASLGLIALLPPLQGHAQGGPSPHDYGFQARGGAIFFDLNTDLRVDGRTLRGSTIDLEDDLDLPSLPAIPFLELSFGTVFRMHLAFMQSVREGEERVDENIRYNGARMAIAGDEMGARSEIFTADLFFSTPLYRKQAIRVEIIAGGKYVHLENRLRNQDPADPSLVERLRSTDTVDAPGLYLGIGGHLVLGPTLTLYSRFLFTKYTWDVFDTERFSYSDFTLGLTYRLFATLSLSVDYRLYDLEVVEDNSGHRSSYETFGNGVGLSALWAF